METVIEDACISVAVKICYKLIIGQGFLQFKNEALEEEGMKQMEGKPFRMVVEGVANDELSRDGGV